MKTKMQDRPILREYQVDFRSVYVFIKSFCLCENETDRSGKSVETKRLKTSIFFSKARFGWRCEDS